MLLLTNIINCIYSEYLLAIVFFNILTYVIMIYGFFSIMFLFNIKYIKTLTELKYINYMDTITSIIILLFLSLAGIPPLLGFCSKLLLFIIFISKTNIGILFFFIVFNFFSMYFYIQNLRFIVSKEPRNYFLFKNNYVYFNKNMLSLIILINLLNIFGIFYLDDIFIYLYSVYSYIY